MLLAGYLELEKGFDLNKTNQLIDEQYIPRDQRRTIGKLCRI